MVFVLYIVWVNHWVNWEKIKVKAVTHWTLKGLTFLHQKITKSLPKSVGPFFREGEHGKCQICTLKPIFHQNAKYLASGVGVGQCTQRQNFALPNAKYTNMLVSLALGDAHFSRFTRRET